MKLSLILWVIALIFIVITCVPGAWFILLLIIIIPLGFYAIGYIHEKLTK